MYRKFAGLTLAGAVLLAIFAGDDGPSGDDPGPVVAESDVRVAEAPAAAPQQSAGAWGMDAAPDEDDGGLPQNRNYSGASQAEGGRYIPEDLRGNTPAQRDAISARLEAQSAIRSGSV